MNDIQSLYQQVILDHNKNPRNFGPLLSANHSADGLNPLCGDDITVHLLIENDIIKEISFEGSGCAIAKSSASIMTTVLKGKTIEQAEQLFNDFHFVVTAPMDADLNEDSLGKMAVFTGIREFPARVKCASLAWHTMQSALHGKNITSTE